MSYSVVKRFFMCYFLVAVDRTLKSEATQFLGGAIEAEI